MNATYTTWYDPPGAVELEKAAEYARELGRAAKFAAMLLAAPFLGLAFVIAFPLAGLGYLAWMAIKALPRAWAAAAPVVKRLALFAAAPLVGLAYVIAFPFVGVGVMAYCAVRAARN